MNNEIEEPQSIIATIDGEKTTLTLVYKSRNGYQYNTKGNCSAHTFPFYLRPGTLITNGHRYVIPREQKAFQSWKQPR